MIMKYLLEQPPQEPEETPPDWVTKTNVSYRAWLLTLKIYAEKREYIDRCHRKSELSRKYSFSISGAWLAKELGIKRTTLMHSSSYSSSFTTFLNQINAELLDRANKRIGTFHKPSARGTIRDRKDELLNVNKSLRKSLEELEQLKVAEIVNATLAALPLNIRRKLGLL